MSATESKRSPGNATSSGSPVVGQIELACGLVLDARRAAFLPESQTLIVADLHLGYAWVQRQRGALIPLSAPDPVATRFRPLMHAYAPRTVVVLGDLVHAALATPGVAAELEAFANAIPTGTQLVVCLGNHDRGLERLASRLALEVSLVREFTVGRFRFHHGDGGDFALKTDSIQVIGHEHPALSLSDGVASQAKVPCFLEASETIVLPAFSDWAAGCVLGRSPWLGETARSARFTSAYACMGPRLLRVPWRKALGRAN